MDSKRFLNELYSEFTDGDGFDKYCLREYCDRGVFIMGKNKEMLRCFFRVMRNNEEEIKKVVPDIYCENFYTIDVNSFIKREINKLIIDIDGTILPADSIEVPLELVEKIAYFKDNGMDMCLVSNNGYERVLPVAEKLDINIFLANASKPLPQCFDNVVDLFETNKKSELVMIGDQMLSDIKGASEYGIRTCLVRPISKHQNIKTGTSRMLQDVMEHHLARKRVFDKNKYYN